MNLGSQLVDQDHFALETLASFTVIFVVLDKEATKHCSELLHISGSDLTEALNLDLSFFLLHLNLFDSYDLLDVSS